MDKNKTTLNYEKYVNFLKNTFSNFSVAEGIVCSWMKQAIDEQIESFFDKNSISLPKQRYKCDFDNDYCNTSLFIVAPYLLITLDYSAGSIFIHRDGYENKRYNDNKFVLFSDFDTKRECYNPYNEVCDNYKGSIKQMFDYVKYVYIPTILDPVFDIYKKATKKKVEEIVDFDKVLKSLAQKEAD